MKIIQKETKFVTNVIMWQNIYKSKKYRLITYSYKFVYNNNVYLYNNLTKELILLNDDENRKLSNTNYDCSDSLITYLIRHWFLVPVDNDDIKLQNQFFCLSKQCMPRKSIVNYIILPTTACNARCFYCFEAGAKISTMDNVIAKKVAKFIVEKSNGNPVKINWFGGEPLCNINAINFISDYLLCKEVDFRSTIISNGFLFNQNIIVNAKNIWNLKTAQITLDGMDETYNKVKNYKTTISNPFQKVIGNIRTLLTNNISVVVRLNVDKHNSKELYNLVDYLWEQFGNFENFKVYPHFLFDLSINFERRSEKENCNIFNDFIKLETQIKEKNISISNNENISLIKTNFCMADDYKSVLITPTGKIGKCEHFIQDEFCVDMNEYNENLLWDKYDLPEKKCEKCFCLPSYITLKDCPDVNHKCSDFHMHRKSNMIKEKLCNLIDKKQLIGEI